MDEKFMNHYGLGQGQRGPERNNHISRNVLKCHYLIKINVFEELII